MFLNSEEVESETTPLDYMEKNMKIDLGAKKVSVNRISRVVETGPYTATVKFIFGNAIKVLCCSSEFVDEPTYGSIFSFHGTPKELRDLVKRLKNA